MPQWRMWMLSSGAQALAGVILASVGVACQFGIWYALIVAGGLFVALALADRR